MKGTLIVLTACLIAMMLLAGCKGSGSASLFGSGDNTTSARLPDDDNPGPGDDDPGPGDDDPDPGDDIHLPEPATMALLGSGLLAYALLRRKKKK